MEDKKLIVKWMIKDGMSYRQIRDAVGVSLGTISNWNKQDKSKVEKGQNMNMIQQMEILHDVRMAWKRYKLFLKKKYPADKGETWGFTCPYHAEIERLLNEKGQTWKTRN